jgi:ankyrin repeat protein
MKRQRLEEGTMVKEAPLIWVAGKSIASTGSVLVRLAQNGYTKEAHSIIALSRSASLVGRDSIGGLTELWDVMGNVKGKDGITRLMSLAINRSSFSVQRAQSLIRDHAADASTKDVNNRTALHHSLGFRLETDSWPNHNINDDLVKVLLDAYPEATREFCFGTLPLHFACLQGASLNLVYMLIDKNIEAVSVKDKNEMLPLHYLCASKSALLECAKWLIDWYPEGVATKDWSDRTPLLYALGAHFYQDTWPTRSVSKEDAALISLLLFPGALTHRWEPENSCLPIHIACKNKAPREILDILLKHYPEAIYAKDDNGMLPLHFSCASGSAVSAISLLLDCFPESIACADVNGMLPLHYACKSGDCDAIKLLTERHPAALMASTRKGCYPTAFLSPTSHARSFLLPIHSALESNISVEEVCAIIQSNQDFVRQTDEKGMLPLHIACVRKAHLFIIQSLLRSYPESIRIKYRKNLPLALALTRKCGLDTLRSFMEIDVTIVQESSEFSRLPLHIACIYNDDSEEDFEVISLLVKAHPQGKTQLDYFNRNPMSYLANNTKAMALFH